MAPPSVSSAKRMASDAPSGVMCMICQDVMDGGQERLMSLLCTHTFHEYCIRTYCDETSSTVECIRCPSCRRTAADVQQLPVPSDAVGGGVMAPPDVAANGAHDVEASNVLQLWLQSLIQLWLQSLLQQWLQSLVQLRLQSLIQLWLVLLQLRRWLSLIVLQLRM